MAWWAAIKEFLMTIPAVAKVLEKWLDKKIAEIPMDEIEHDEKKELREIKNDIKEVKKDGKLDKVTKRVAKRKTRRAKE